jgi:hypothetical protein
MNGILLIVTLDSMTNLDSFTGQRLANRKRVARSNYGLLDCHKQRKVGSFRKTSGFVGLFGGSGQPGERIPPPFARAITWLTHPAREAGASVKPGASAPGSETANVIEPAERATARNENGHAFISRWRIDCSLEKSLHLSPAPRASETSTTIPGLTPRALCCRALRALLPRYFRLASQLYNCLCETASVRVYLRK